MDEFQPTLLQALTIAAYMLWQLVFIVTVLSGEGWKASLAVLGVGLFLVGMVVLGKML